MNINDSFFEGHYKDIWKAMIPGQLTAREVQFMLDYFKLQPGDRVLDMMCGYGRHALELASKGMEVTAVDNLADYIKEINEKAVVDNLPVKALQANVTDYRPSGNYKLVICMGNSLNFFDAKDVSKLLSNWAVVMPAGSYLLINSWSLAETVIPHFTEKSEASFAGINIASDSRYLFHPTRVETKTEMKKDDGELETRLAVDYVYSVNEMELFFSDSGFLLEEVYNIPGKKKFAVGDPRSYIIGRRL